MMKFVKLFKKKTSKIKSIDDQWAGFSNTLKSVTEETLGLQPRDHRSSWFEEDHP